MAAGAGYSFQLRKTDRVSVAFFGDGAVNNGAFHEGLNMAAIWKLPVLFVCENNQYATEVPFVSVAGNPTSARAAPPTACPASNLDGNDVEAVFDAPRAAVARARAGEGPTLLACTTYRTRAHSEGMRDAGYRTREEVESWRARDPIERFRDRVGTGSPTRELDAVEREIQAIVAEALEWAKSSPYPDADTALDHVYDEPERSASMRELTSPRPPAKAWPRRWNAIRWSSSLAKGSARAAATSPRPSVCSSASVPSACATRRSPSAAFGPVHRRGDGWRAAGRRLHVFDSRSMRWARSSIRRPRSST